LQAQINVRFSGSQYDDFNAMERRYAATAKRSASFGDLTGNGDKTSAARTMPVFGYRRLRSRAAMQKNPTLGEEDWVSGGDDTIASYCSYQGQVLSMT
jgi:hypothetical protein